jgi:hypothetical protein
MSNVQAFVLGAMAALTPSLLLLAFLIWREGVGLTRERDENAHAPPR